MDGLEQRQRGVVAIPRDAAARHPGDVLLEGLVGRLSMQSSEFARLRAGHGVKECTGAPKIYLHPDEGPLNVVFEAMTVLDRSTISVMAHLPGDEHTAAALERLAAARGRSARTPAARLEVDHERYAV